MTPSSPEHIDITVKPHAVLRADRRRMTRRKARTTGRRATDAPSDFLEPGNGATALHGAVWQPEAES